MTVSAHEFLRRFLLHVLPRGLVRIRHFGLFANRSRSAALARCRSLLDSAAISEAQPAGRHRCPKCSGSMVVVERLTAAQIYFRTQMYHRSLGRAHVDTS